MRCNKLFNLIIPTCHLLKSSFLFNSRCKPKAHTHTMLTFAVLKVHHIKTPLYRIKVELDASLHRYYIGFTYEKFIQEGSHMNFTASAIFLTQINTVTFSMKVIFCAVYWSGGEKHQLFFFFLIAISMKAHTLLGLNILFSHKNPGSMSLVCFGLEVFSATPSLCMCAIQNQPLCVNFKKKRKKKNYT